MDLDALACHVEPPRLWAAGLILGSQLLERLRAVLGIVMGNTIGPARDKSMEEGVGEVEGSMLSVMNLAAPRKTGDESSCLLHYASGQ